MRNDARGQPRSVRARADPQNGAMPDPDTALLAGQTILITGAARRLGAAIARRLHAGGAAVALHCRSSTAEAATLAASLNAVRDGSAATFICDLNEVAALPQLVQSVTGRFGRLDVLVNNASSFYPTPIGTITPAQFDDLIGTNLRAPVFLAQAAAAELRRTRGSILNMTDIHGQRPLRA